MLGELQLLLVFSEKNFSVQWLTLTFTNVSCWQISHLVVSLTDFVKIEFFFSMYVSKKDRKPFIF